VLRILWNGAVILSLLVCVAAVVLWVRGYFVQDWWQYEVTNSAGRRWTGYTFVSTRDSLYVSVNDYRFKAAGEAEKYSQHTLETGFRTTVSRRGR